MRERRYNTKRTRRSQPLVFFYVAIRKSWKMGMKRRTCFGILNVLDVIADLRPIEINMFQSGITSKNGTFTCALHKVPVILLDTRKYNYHHHQQHSNEIHTYCEIVKKNASQNHTTKI